MPHLDTKPAVELSVASMQKRPKSIVDIQGHPRCYYKVLLRPPQVKTVIYTKKAKIQSKRSGFPGLKDITA